MTVVVKREDCVKALRAVHSRFYLSRTTIAMGIIGPGLIGSTLLDQLKEQVHWENSCLPIFWQSVSFNLSLFTFRSACPGPLLAVDFHHHVLIFLNKGFYSQFTHKKGKMISPEQ